MKIAWFTDTWLPARDGVITSLLAFKKVLEREHEIYIFAPSENDGREGNIFYFRSRPFSRYPNYRISSIRPIFSRKIGKILKKEGIDIVHSHSPAIIGSYAIMASRISSLPLVHTYHTFLHESTYLLGEKFQNTAKKFLDIWLRWYFRRCDAIIVPSRYMAKKLKEYHENIEVIPNGIEVKRFEGGEREKIRKRIGGKIALYVGRIVKEKNLDLVLKASPLLPDITFIIVGDGPYRLPLMERAKKMDAKNIIFTGFVSDEELLDYYKSADVFVFPSTYETQGLVALEAMAAGLPVVAARAKALPEIVVDGKNGYLFSPYDAEDFARKVRLALESERLGEMARRFVEKFDVERMAEKLVDFYDRICNKN